MPPYNPGKGFRKGSRVFGRQFHPIEKKYMGHAGDDWPAPLNTPIPAAYDGVVAKVGYQFNAKKKTGWGWYVTLEHTIQGKKVLTRYAHMPKKSHLSEKQPIKKGESVGLVGSSGGSTGPHLHFEVWVNGVAVNPSTFDFPGEGGASNDSGEGEGEATASTQGSWAYPFRAYDKKAPVHEGLYMGVPGARDGEGALGRSDGGYYPISVGGLWHGGIHFDSGSGTLLDQRGGVLCISDGEVVAYRVNKQYPEIEFLPSKMKAAYSSGFTLVRHRLELPEDASADDKAGSAKGSKSSGKGAKKALVFYSLYMHQLDWKGYQDSPKLPRPGFWGEPKRFRVGAKAKDQQEAPAPTHLPASDRLPLRFEPGAGPMLASIADGMCDGDPDDDDLMA